MRAFQSSVIGRSPGVPLSVSDLTAWLREKRLVWPLHMVCHRARLVERFLEWSHAHAVISTNPFVELHQHWGPRTTSIVRALVSDDVEAALQGLRPTPRFGSFLGETMAEYVRLKRTLGYRYNVNERMLLRFDRFLQHHADFVGKPLNQLVDKWAQADPSPFRLWEASRVGKLMSKAMNRSNPAASTSAGAYPAVRLEQRQPYTYSDEEIHVSSKQHWRSHPQKPLYGRSASIPWWSLPTVWGCGWARSSASNWGM